MDALPGPITGLQLPRVLYLLSPVPLKPTGSLSDLALCNFILVTFTQDFHRSHFSTSPRFS